MKIFPYIFTIMVFIIVACVVSSDDARFHDHAGTSNTDLFAIKINYGTIEFIEDTIVSNTQAPLVTIHIKSNSPNRETLHFKLKNIKTSPLPTKDQDRGEIKIASENNSIYYSLSLEPYEDFIVTISSHNNSKNYSFGAVGDIQYNIEAAEKLAQNVTEQDLDFMIILGDLVQRGTQEEYDWAYEFTSNFPIPVYVIYGNHDAGSIFSDGYKHFRKNYGSTNVKFHHKGDLFLLLDAANQGLSNEVFTFAQETLNQTNAPFKYVFQHTPPFEKSGFRNNSFNTSFSAARYLDLMIDHNVNVILSGHVHTYQDFQIEGVRNLIVGTGGGLPERLDGHGNGYVILRKNNDQLTVNRIELEKQ